MTEQYTLQDVILELELANESLPKIEHATFETGFVALELVERLDKVIMSITGFDMKLNQSMQRVIEAIETGTSSTIKAINDNAPPPVDTLQEAEDKQESRDNRLEPITNDKAAEVVADDGPSLSMILGAGTLAAAAVYGIFQDLLGEAENALRSTIFGSKIAAGITKGWTAITQVVSKGMAIVFKGIEGLKVVFAPMQKLMSHIFTVFKTLTGTGQLGKLLTFGKVFTKIFSRLLIPLQLAIGVWEGAARYNEEQGSKAEKIVEAFKGLVNGVIGWAFDLPIQLAQWIYASLGWENAAKSLEGVSFDKIFSSIVDVVNKMVLTVVESIYSAAGKIKSIISGDLSLADALGQIGKALDQMGPALIRWVLDMLPDLALKLVPDKVLEYAGVTQSVVQPKNEESRNSALNNGARILADPQTPEKEKMRVRNLLEETYGFSSSSITEAIRNNKAVDIERLEKVSVGAELSAMQSESNDLEVEKQAMIIATASSSPVHVSNVSNNSAITYNTAAHTEPALA